MSPPSAQKTFHSYKRKLLRFMKSDKSYYFCVVKTVYKSIVFE